MIRFDYIQGQPKYDNLKIIPSTKKGKILAGLALLTCLAYNIIDTKPRVVTVNGQEYRALPVSRYAAQVGKVITLEGGKEHLLFPKSE